jgi:hypothetical protein
MKLFLVTRDFPVDELEVTTHFIKLRLDGGSMRFQQRQPLLLIYSRIRLRARSKSSLQVGPVCEF